MTQVRIESALFGGSAAREFHRRRFDALHRAEHDLVALSVDDDGVARVEFLPENLLRERVLDQALDRTPQWPCTQRRVIDTARDHQLGRIRELEAQPLRLPFP